MIYRKLLGTELELSVIAFGAWAIGGWMWGGSDKSEAIMAIHRAMDLGITTYDTAPVYGFGQSESLIGKAIHGNRKNLQIITKCGLRWDNREGEFYFKSRDQFGRDIDIFKFSGKESIISECEKSLKRLKTDYIDLYQIHWHDSSTSIEEAMEALSILVKSGKIRYAGVSNFSSELIEEASKYTDLVSDQVPYSMINKDIEKDLIPYCYKKNVNIIAYSPLQRGLLTGKITPNYQFKEGDHRAENPFFSAENIKEINKMLDNFKNLCMNHSASLSQIVLNWTMQQPGIAIVLAGARNAHQVEQNALSTLFMLDSDEIQFINDEISKLELTT